MRPLGSGRPGARVGIIMFLLLSAVLLAGCGARPPPECDLIEDWDGWQIEITMLDGTVENRTVYPSPQGLDADGDGLDDCTEYLSGTDPNDADTAANGLLDGNNVVLSSGSARAEEWEARGIAFRERDDGRLEFQGARAWGVEPTMQDTAGSGILDGVEVAGYTVWILGEARTVTTDPRRADSSGDGLRDGLKRDLGLDPTVRDTDGDGVDDTNDANPWVDFMLRLEVVSLNLTNDPHGRSQRTIWVVLQVPSDEFRSAPTTVQVGATTDGDAFSSEGIVPDDRGGDIVVGRHNLSFAFTVVSMEGEQFIAIDLVSDTTGTTTIYGDIHALTGRSTWNAGGPAGEGTQWPATARFAGAHGDITLRILPVWPAAWQACIDDGCRHGNGDFPWR